MPVPLPGKKALWRILVVCAILAGLAWWQQDRLWSWYYVRNLAGAEGQDREVWIERIALLPNPCLPRLFNLLEGGDTRAIDNARAALGSLLSRWEPNDSSTSTLVTGLRDRFSALSIEGKYAGLAATRALWRPKEPIEKLHAGTAAPLGDMLAEAEHLAELRGPAISLAAGLVERVPEGQWRELSIRLARAGLRDRDPEVRIAAVHLLLRPVLKKDQKLLAEIVPLFRDPVAEVRRSALVALGPCRDLVGEDILLPLLHDADEQVRLLCELALRGRGLNENHLLLARLISDDSPAARMQVLQHLDRSGDLDPTVWLERLTQDPTPAVRAAAVRAAAGMEDVDFGSRLLRMSREDPSPTVRQLAEHYGKISDRGP